LHAGWEQVLDKWGVQAVLVPPNAMAQGLLLEPRWHAEYRDSQAIVFLPSHPAEIGNQAR
jgi:hypothetical protein